MHFIQTWCSWLVVTKNWLESKYEKEPTMVEMSNCCFTQTFIALEFKTDAKERGDTSTLQRTGQSSERIWKQISWKGNLLIIRGNDAPFPKITFPGDLTRRRLDIPTGRQTYRAFKVKLILLVPNDQKTKNVIKFNQDFLFRHILNYIIFCWGEADFL